MERRHGSKRANHSGQLVAEFCDEGGHHRFVVGLETSAEQVGVGLLTGLDARPHEGGGFPDDRGSQPVLVALGERRRHDRPMGACAEETKEETQLEGTCMREPGHRHLGEPGRHVLASRGGLKCHAGDPHVVRAGELQDCCRLDPGIEQEGDTLRELRHVAELVRVVGIDD